jgi:hypothetical protein
MKNKMKNQQTKILIFAMFSVAIILSMAVPLMAQENELRDKLGNPGITPDSSFYFLDRMFDWTQSVESRANEKAAEIFTMAREGKLEQIKIAREHYEKAMEKRQIQSKGNEEVAEKAAVQATDHLIVLANVLNQVPEEAKGSIQLVMDFSTDKRDESINTLTELDPSRGKVVARETLERIMTETSTQAQEGLTKAFNSIESTEYSERRGRY